MKLIHEDTFKIFYENTDSSGFTYHTSYLALAERARSNMLNENFPEISLMLKENSYFFVIKKLQIDFFKPTNLFDKLTISTFFKSNSLSSIDLIQKIKKESLFISEIIICLVWINGKTKKPSRIPSDLISRFKALEVV
jgi:acyl-CoA thioester hydrolase